MWQNVEYPFSLWEKVRMREMGYAFQLLPLTPALSLGERVF
jgi:hypothetical protein